jgi:hypothetical protein
MPYLGNAPAEAYSNISYQDFGTQSGTVFTLDFPAGTPGELEVFVNNVRQEPSVAYTVSGTTLTMTGTVAASDDFYVVFQGKAQQTVVPPDASVSAAKLESTLDLSGKTLTMPSGAVIQVKAASDTSIRTTSSQTFEIASNTAQVTITPFSSSSKFLITCTGVMSADDGQDGWFTTIFRDSTNLGNGSTGLAHGNSVPAVSVNFFPFSMTILDSPATASDIVYGLQFRGYDIDGDSGTARLGQHAGGTSSPVPTHITVMEIAG